MSERTWVAHRLQNGSTFFFFFPQGMDQCVNDGMPLMGVGLEQEPEMEMLAAAAGEPLESQGRALALGAAVQVATLLQRINW